MAQSVSDSSPAVKKLKQGTVHGQLLCIIIMLHVQQCTYEISKYCWSASELGIDIV